MESSETSLAAGCGSAGKAGQDRGVVYMSAAGDGGAGWGWRRVMTGLSPSGAASEVGISVTEAAIAIAISSS